MGVAAAAMNWLVNPAFGAADWLGLFLHFFVLSLLAVGGAIATASDMHRYVVTERQWISDAQFTDSIALAQAAPGPNLLFVAVIGFNVAGLAGAAVTMVGILMPSTALAIAVGRYGQRRAGNRGVRAFTAGMAPLTIGLVLATGWLLTEPTRNQPAALVLLVLTVLATWRTKLSPMWLIAAGAVVGALGWI
jgi:chromate transporter